MNLKNIHRFSNCVLMIFLLLTASAQAAKVTQAKTTKVLVDLEGDTVAENDEFFLINPATTKKTAIIRIKQIKNGKALAEIVKGKAASGYTLQAKAATPRPMSAEVAEERPSARKGGGSSSKSLGPSWGLLGEYVMASMATTFTRTTPTAHTATSDMKGTGLGAGAFYNHIISQSFTLAAEGSLQQFNASGSTSLPDCNNSTICDVKIMYLSMYGLGRYYFNPASTFKFWTGAGVGFLLAMTKSSSVLNTGQISTNQVFSAALGADYHTSLKTYIPFSLQMDMFPNSASVKATSMTLRFGYAWNL